MEPTVEMIDLHCHILAGLDDGPQTMAESIRMCRIAYRDGIRTIVATPHTLNGMFQNNKPEILAKVNELNKAIKHLKQKLNSEIGNPQSEMDLNILPGSDIHLSETTIEMVDRNEALTIGDAGKYVLIEFPPYTIPFQAERILFQLLTGGIIPVITHPERNQEIWTRPNRYYEMIKMGCLGQVTAMSLTGDFGPKVKQWAERLLRSGLIHLIASDAHSDDGRPPVLSSAVRAAAKIVGKEEALRMVTEYPRVILEGGRFEVPEPLPP